MDLALNKHRVRSQLVRFPEEDVVLKRNRLSLIFALAGALAISGTVSQGAQAPEMPNKKTGRSPESDPPKKDKTVPSAQADPTVSQAPAGYQIGADDELMISVWHEPELSQAVVVRPDGIITLPLLNDVKVAGMTTVELQAALTERLKAVGLRSVRETASDDHHGSTSSWHPQDQTLRHHSNERSISDGYHR